MEEATIRIPKTEVERVSMSKGILKLAMEGLTILIIPVHRARTRLGGGGGGPSEVGIRLKGCLLRGQGKTSIFGRGRLKGQKIGMGGHLVELG